MKFLITCLVLCCAVVSIQAQDDMDVKLKTSSNSFNFDVYPLPQNIQLRTADKGKWTLKTEGVALLYIWSYDGGGSPELWNKAVELHHNYESKGLKFIAVNFQNGGDFQYQHQKFNEFLSANSTPFDSYFDYMGYAVDMLQIPSFPAYLLVKDGDVIFTARGNARDAMFALEGELDRLLDNK